MANEIKYKVGFDVNHSDLNKLKSSLQQLQKLSISDIMKINNVDSQAATKALGDITREASKVQDALNKAFNVKLGTVNIETFNKALHDSTTSMDQVYATFKKGGAAGENTFRTLANEVTKTNIQLKQSHSLLDNIATTLTNTIKWNLASSAVNTMSQSIQQAWGYVKNLDNSLNDIRIVTNKSAEQMGNFAVQANQAAQSLGRTTTDYTKAALIYAQQGLDDEEIAARTAVTLKTANVTGQSTAEVSEQLTAVWNGYKVNAEQAEVYVDRLAAVAATTASDLQELSTGMSKVASAAAAMGVGEDQLAAQLSTIISVTRQAPESIGTALRTIYARITDIKAGIDEDGVDLGRYSGKMAELGFNVLDAAGNLRDMGQVIEEIGYKWQDLTREQQVSLAQIMAGQRQYSNLIALFDNFDKYTEALNTAREAAGTLNEQQDIYLERTSTHLTQLKAATQNLYDSLLNPQALNPLIDGLASVMNFGASFVESLGGGVPILLSLGSIGLDVFNKQIAQGINTVITNFEAAKENARQFGQSLQAVQKWQGIASLDKTSQQLLNMKEQMLVLAKNATPQQFNAMQQALNKLVTSGNKIKDLEDQKNEINELIIAITTAAGKKKEFDDVLKENDGAENLSQQLYNQKITFDTISEQIEDYKKDIQSFDSSQQAIEALTKKIQQLKAAFGDNAIFAPFKAKLQQISQSFSNIPNNLSPDALQSRLMQIANLVTDTANRAGQKAQEAGSKILQGIQEIPGALQQATNDSQTALGNFEKIVENITREKILQGFTKISGGLTQMLSAMNQIKNLGSIWNDKDASTGQKIFKTVQNLAVTIPLLLKGANALRVGMQLLNTTKIAGAAADTTAGAAAVAHAGAQTTLTVATKAATAAQAELIKTMLLNPYTKIAVAIAAIVAVIAALIEHQKAAAEAALQHNRAIIEEEKAKQQQIDKNEQLLLSIQKLEQEYQNGQIATRAQLRSEIDKLTDQYDVEEDYIDELIKRYGSLAEGIRQVRLEKAKEKQQSLQTSYDAAKTNFEDVYDNKGRSLYVQDINTKDRDSNLTSLLQPFLTQQVQNYYDNRGNYTGSVTKQILRVPEELDKAADLYQILSENLQQFQNDPRYGFLVKWIEAVKQEAQVYIQERDNLNNYLDYAILNNQFSDFSKTNTLEEYQEQRNQLINDLLKETSLSDQEVQKKVDSYLKRNYTNLYNQHNDVLKYTEQLKNRFKDIDDNLLETIKNLNPDQLSFLMDYIDLDNVDDWKDLEGVIFRISQMDLSNVSEALSPKENATDNYTFWNSLEQQIRSGKSISEKEFKDERLAASGLQSYFSGLANSQYKMIGDAEAFYEKINSLKLSGFLEAIDEINKSIELTQKLQEKSFDYNNLAREAYSYVSPPTNRGRTQVIDEGGSELSSKDVKYLSVDIDLMKEQIEYLSMFTDGNNDLALSIENWNLALNQATKDSSVSFEQSKKLKDIAVEISKELVNVKDQTQNLDQQLAAHEEELRRTQQALYDALNPTDADIDESQLFGLTQLIKDVAKQDDDFADSLDSDARSAQAVAQSILRFNNAIEDLVKNYETWHGILSNENVTMQQLATIMQPLRDAYADLLDLDGSSLSSDFLQSTTNLQLMKAAIDGNIESYNQLRQLAAQDIITHLDFDTETARTDFMNQFSNVLAWMNDHEADFHIGATFDGEDALIGSLTRIINATEMTADKAQDLLLNAFGINAQVIQQTKSEPVERTITGYDYDVDYQRVRGVDPLTRQDAQYYVPRVQPKIIKKKTTDGVVATGSALKIMTARKSAGGEIKWTHSSQGAGYTGTTRRTQEAAKAAKSTPKPDTSTKEPTKYAKDDRDIYHDINIEIQDIGRELSRVQKQGNKLAGTDLIKNLNKQLQILTKQKVKLQQKNELQKLDLQRQKQQLSLLGVTFDEYGHINNYLDVMGNKIGIVNGYIEAENAIISQYNATTDKEAKDAINQRLTEVQRQREDAEDAKKDLESAIKDYDGMIDKIEDLADQVTDLTQQRIQIQISKFKMKVELTLDMRSLQQDYNEFVRNVINADDLFRISNGDKLYKNAQKIYDDYLSYYDVANENSIATLTQQIAEARRQYEETGNSEWLDAMKSYVSQLESSMENMKKLQQDIQQIYFDTMNDIDAQADRQVDQYEYLEEQLQHDIDLVKLIYGQHQYDAMQSYYSQLRANNQEELSFLKSYADQLWAAREKAMIDGYPELAEEYLKLWEETNSKINAKLKESIENAKNEYLNAIDKIYYELELKLSNNKGFDYLSMEWELVNKNADQYLDTVNAAYAVQELERKFRNAIDENKNVKAQRALTDLMNQQLDYLKSKDKLTQYDVDRAEKLLQIQQARYALEDSRNAKTSLRLRRDSQGNYSYVYTANEDQVSNAEEQLAKLQNELYNFDKDAYQDNLDDVLAATKEYLDKRKDLQIQYNYADEEQKARLAEQLKLLDDNYYQYLEDKATENSVIRKNLQNSVAQECENLYTNNQQLFEAMTKGNYTNFEEMSDSIKTKLIDDLVPGYRGGIQEMIDVFYGTGGDGDLTSFRGTCLEAWNQVDEVTSNYGEAVASLAEKAGTDLGSIKTGVDGVADAYRDLIPENATVLQGFVDQQKEIDKLLLDLDALKLKNQDVWDAAVTEIGEATKALQDYAKEALEALKIPSPADDNYSGTPSLPDAPTTVPASVPAGSSGGGSGSSNTEGSSSGVGGASYSTPEEKQPKDVSVGEGIAGNIYWASHQRWGNSPSDWDPKIKQVLPISIADMAMREVKQILIDENAARVKNKNLAAYQTYDYIGLYNKKHGTRLTANDFPYYTPWSKKAQSLDTGGYTGEWGPDGRWALLHQKELVLNADDTKNMLNSVSILRDIVSNVGGKISAKMSRLGGYTMPVQPKPADELQQSVSIQASFPNVNSKREIEEALNDLVNLAAQRALRRR